jgi:RNA polymerase sigma-70 factor (ECF subfamily)
VTLAIPQDRAAAVADVFREEAGRITSLLIRRFGDFDLAEESTQEALLAGLQAWPASGIPHRPGAWLLTVASRLALNRLKREKRYREKLAQLPIEPVSSEVDDRIRLILVCCHPALSREAQVALTLRAVCGFTNPEIARALLVSETAVAQRLVRAKRRIAGAGIPFRMPDAAELPDRLNEVLAVLYLMFNEAHLSTGEEPPFRRDLAEDAMWLTALLLRLIPDQPEILGLLALMKLQLARGWSRFSATGSIVLLEDQDRRSWDRTLIAEGVLLIERAAALHRPGPYQLEAAIAACHAEAPTFEETDWRQILVLYDMLAALDPTPVVRLNRAIVLARVETPSRALQELDGLAPDLEGYHLFHAARGELLADLGRTGEASDARREAMRLAKSPAERALLDQRLAP